MGGRPADGRSRLALRGRGVATAADTRPCRGVPADSGARDALRPSPHRPGRRPRRHRLAAVRSGAAGARRRHLARHDLADRAENERLASEAKQAEQTFLARTAGLLNACAVAWYRAAVLLRLACKCVRRRSDWLAHGHALLCEAVRQTEAAG